MRKQLLSSVLALSLLAVPSTANAQIKEAFRNLTGGGGADAKQIAHFKLKGAVAETPTGIPPLFGGEPPLSLKSLLERFKEARLDDRVVAVVVDIQGVALGLGQLQEIHEAMRKFAAVDKEVFLHADTLSTGLYALATGASQVSMVPTGELWLTGLYGESPYLRGALDKLGCVPDFEHCGDFKTGPEIYTREGPSDEAKEMNKWLLDAVFEEVVQLIADARELSVAKVKALINEGPYSAEEALEAGLIDSVQHRQDFIAELEQRYGSRVEVVANYGKKDAWDVPQDNMFAMFEFLMQMLNPTPKVYSKPSVAIIYVEGAIQTGAGNPSPFGGTDGAFSTPIRRALDEAAEDKSVKAVVLRIDSPGGSALASEIILDATRRVAAKKPLVVSMGSVAASGGYYVTCASDMVFANAGTITSSIGVWGGKIVTTGLWDKVGINWHANKRGDKAALFSTASKFSDAERTTILRYMNEVYATFKGHVVAARGDKLTKPIDAMAGGRVFSGRQALELGLVDRIGGLEDAIKFAAKRAKLSDPEIRVIPEPPTIFDMLAGPQGDDAVLGISGSLKRALIDQSPLRTLLPLIAEIDPLRARAIVRALVGLDIVQQEGVAALMPGELLIR